MEQGLADSMASDESLVGFLRRRGCHTILCVGNGLSTEAAALALHGFHVTALDISAVPGELFTAKVLREPEHPFHRIPGFGLRDDGAVTFGPPDPIDTELCPPMHRSVDQRPRRGGSLLFVTGDLMNPDLCPGPFDLVIERRTVQLFPAGERELALERLVTRLGARGVLVSHEHQGARRPGQSQTHYAESELKRGGFVVRSGWRSTEPYCVGRLAWLMFSSG